MTLVAPQLNTSICTLQDIAPVLQSLNDIIQQLYTIINVGGGADTFKVLVNGSDASPDYLHAKITHIATAAGSNAVPVNSFTQGDTTESFYWQPDDINNFGAAANMYLAVVSGSLTWVEINATVDANTVLVTGGDSAAKYLHSAFNLNATYVGGADILVATATVGAAATNQTEQLFVDVSVISGWAGTGDFFLGMHNNAVSWMTFSDVISGGLSVGYALDISSSTVSFDPTEITGFAAAFQFFGHLASASAATDPAWITISGYDATKKQISWHQSGSFSFNTVTNYDAGTAQHLSHINGVWQFLGAPRFAIATEAIPAATGNYNGSITPGKTNGSSNIRLYDFGAGYGDPATQSTLGKCENYMFSVVAIHKPIFVFERAPGIFVLPTEGCTAVPAV